MNKRIQYGFFHVWMDYYGSGAGSGSKRDGTEEGEET